MFDDDEVLIEEKILNNCQPYLKLLKHLYQSGMKRPLLRGSAEPFNVLTRIPVKERKQPMNMEKVDHEITNQWFKDTFGIAARSHTVFVTTNRGLAKHYGTIHYVFPIGKFSIINSPDYADLFLQLGWLEKARIYKDIFNVEDEINLETYKDAKTFLEELKNKEYEKYEKVITYILENGNYQKNNYKEAFKNGNEIMLKCKAFYIINADDERINDFINDFIWDEVYI